MLQSIFGIIFIVFGVWQIARDPESFPFMTIYFVAFGVVCILDVANKLRKYRKYFRKQKQKKAVA